MRNDAPACAHFGILPDTAGAFPFSSFVPSAAEPGEIVARLLIQLDKAFASPDWRMFLVSLGYENNRASSTVRGTVLMAHSEADVAWAREHCQELDMYDNAIAFRDRDDKKFSVATGIRVNERTHKLAVTFVVANGVTLTSDNHKWYRAFRIALVRLNFRVFVI